MRENRTSGSVRGGPGNRGSYRARTPIMRACGAIIRDGKILMVRHQHEGRNYWTLPGGGLEHGETPAQAAIREVAEETGLIVSIDRLVSTQEYSGGLCYIFLMLEQMPRQTARLGYDPEEEGQAPSDRMLKAIDWFALNDKANDIQVSQVLTCLEGAKTSPEREVQ